VALTVVPDLTLVCDGSSGQDAYWSGENGVSTEVFQQGTSSQAWIVSKNASETAVYDYYAANLNTAADLSATDTHLYFHMRCDIAPFIDYMKIRITDGSGNYNEWDIVDNITAIEWYGEWKTFVIDIASTPSASSGTLVESDIRTFSWTVDNSNSGNIRSIENTYIDVCRFGTGITAYDNAGDVFNFEDIEAISNHSANKYGIIEMIGGVLFVRGRITVGDASPNLYTANFETEDELLIFLDASVSGEAISDTLLGVTVAGTKDGTTNFTMGNKLGSGDTLNGSNGTLMLGENTNVVVVFDFPNTTAIDSMNIYGSTFRRTGGVIDIEGATEVGGCTFDGCGQITTGGATVRNCTFLNTLAVSPAGAILLEPDYDMKYCLFSNNAVAIQTHTTQPASYTAVGIAFIGNTVDILYDATVDRDWNWSETASGPSITNTSTGTLTAVNTVNLDVGGLTTTARLYILTLAGGPASAGVVIENSIPGTTEWTDTYAFVSDQPVKVRVRDASSSGSEKRPFEVDTTITSTGMDLVAILINDT